MEIFDCQVSKYYKCQFADEDKFLAAIAAICLPPRKYEKQKLINLGIYQEWLEKELSLAREYMTIYLKIKWADGMITGSKLRTLAKADHEPMLYLKITDPKETERSFDYE